MNENKINQMNDEKMFTQEDVNRIIGERLSRDKQKGVEGLDKRENELALKELKFTAKQLLAEKGLPLELAEIINLTDEKSVTEAVELLSGFIVPKKKNDKLKVIERKLPESENEDDNYGQLRKAFGLV